MMKFFYRIKIREIPLHIDLEGLSAMVSQECSGIAKELNMHRDRLFKYRLIVEEACINSIKHGYDGNPGLITLRFYLYKDTLITEIKDNGKGFDAEKELDKLLMQRLDFNALGEKMGLLLLLKASDDLEIESIKEAGTLVRIYYNLFPVNII